MGTQINKFGAIVPESVTKSFYSYSSEMHNLELLMVIFIIIAGELIKENRSIVKNTFIALYKDEKNELSKRLIDWIQEDKNFDQLIDKNYYKHFFGQMAYSRSVNNFITYLKDLLEEVAIKKPEVLKSKDQETLEFILGFDDINELRRTIAKNKIGKLFYSGLLDIEKFFKDHLGIDLFGKEYDSIDLIISIRNLIVHNRGRINSEFKKKFPARGEIGDYYSFAYEDISKLNIELNNLTVEIDKKVSAKFGLELIDLTNR